MSKLSFKTKSLVILILTLILGAILCPSIFVSHGSTYADSVDYNNYYFSKYHVDIEYDYENNINVNEYMTVVYGATVNGKHKGIVRALPSTTVIARGSVSDDYKRTIGVKVTNVSANDLYDFYKEDGVYCIELGGDEYINNNGSVTKGYVLSYTVNIGDDFTRDFDYVYYNIFGTDFPVAINNATFSVTMPTDIPNDMVYYVGKQGNDKPIVLEKQTLADGRVKFEMNTPIDLEAYEGISVKTILDEGYFKGLKGVISKFDATNIAIIIISVVGALAIIVVYVLFGQKRKKYVETVEFYPPDDLNPAECCYLYNGQRDKMSSMFVYWASKGYLKIELDDDKKPKGVRKLQNIPEHLSESEKLAFNKLFENTDYVDITKENKEIAQTFSASALMMTSSMGKRHSSKSTKIKAWTLVLGVLVLLATAMCEALFNRNGMWYLAYVLSLIGVVVVGVGINYVNKGQNTKLQQHKKVVCCLIFVVCLVAVVVANVILNHMTVMWFWTRMLACVPLFIAGTYMSAIEEYNDKWRDTIGKISGFRQNILLVESEKLEKLVDDDPEYFYNILPYAYAFGITEKFIQKFEHLTIPYNDNFGVIVDIAYFNMLRNTLNTFSHVPSSYSGGSIGGGSIGAGGGFGGGGSFGR